MINNCRSSDSSSNRFYNSPSSRTTLLICPLESISVIHLAKCINGNVGCDVLSSSLHSDEDAGDGDGEGDAATSLATIAGATLRTAVGL